MVISIHASRGGSDPMPCISSEETILFQSTLPVGEATRPSYTRCSRWLYFNPRFPWGKRHVGLGNADNTADISIHASRGGSDGIWIFLHQYPSIISIHASRGGSDFKAASDKYIADNFNPRFPWGKRLPARAGGRRKTSDFNPRFPWGKRRQDSETL